MPCNDVPIKAACCLNKFNSSINLLTNNYLFFDAPFEFSKVGKKGV